MLQDLTKPEEHRLRRQLSAIVNFARFREAKLDLYETWRKETDALAEEQAALAETNAQLVRVFISIFTPMVRTCCCWEMRQFWQWQTPTRSWCAFLTTVSSSHFACPEFAAARDTAALAAARNFAAGVRFATAVSTSHGQSLLLRGAWQF